MLLRVCNLRNTLHFAAYLVIESKKDAQSRFDRTSDLSRDNLVVDFVDSYIG